MCFCVCLRVNTRLVGSFSERLTLEGNLGAPKNLR